MMLIWCGFIDNGQLVVCMKKLNLNKLTQLKPLVFLSVFGALTPAVQAEVTLETQVKIADNALHFDGKDVDKISLTQQEMIDDTQYHYKFGGSISAHGDAVKIYKHYVFMSWYRGGKDDRHVMLSRYNTKTGSVKTIEFPHQHTGFQGRWWIGESHNTIGISVSPLNGTIHMVYDMHAYGDSSVPGNKYGDITKYPDEPFKNDFFRYSYSLPGAAEVADEEFTLEKQFVKDTSSVSEGPDDYKHLVMTDNLEDKLNFSALTYPKFFETSDGELLLYMRWGGNNNGAYYYNQYDETAQKWSRFEPFSHKNQKSHGLDHNWGLYGNMKYFNGKLRVGFQKRSSDNNDKYIYQNGIYYAYLDDPENNIWRDHTGKQITWPLVDAEEIKIFEPGDLVKTQDTSANSAGTPPGKVYIVGGFDWAMTDNGDLHFIHKVQDREFNETVYGHLYKPAGAEEFIHAEGIAGAERIYAAGDNIYIIGLENKKPYVEVAKGGTTQFTRIYTDTTTTTNFQHGVAYIKNGKIYYYLMEEKSGTERPIHLQIIDLDLPKVSVNFEQSNLTLIKDYSDLSISATPEIDDPERSIASVALYLDDELVSTLTAEPYTWTQNQASLQNLALGSYQIKALVTDDTGETSESLMTLEVVEGTPTVEFVESDIILAKDYTNFEITIDASTPDKDRTISTVSLYLDDTLISTNNSAPYKWSNANSALQGLATGDYTLKAVVVDSKGETAEASTSLRVVDSTITAAFSKQSYTVSEDYNSLSLSVEASSQVQSRTISDVSLYVNDNLIRTESVAPYEWGHSLDFHDELLDFPIGSHTLKAIVTDSEGQTLEVFADLIVQEAISAPEVSFSESSLNVESGYTELTVNVNASTSMSTRTIKQVALFVNGTQVSALTAAPYQWTVSQTQLANLPAGTHSLKAVATDSQDLQSETSIQLVVSEKEEEPEGNNNSGNGDKAPKSGSGGGSTSPALLVILSLLMLVRRQANIKKRFK